MAIGQLDVREYLQTLDAHTAESRFLRRIPWVIDAGEQPADWLIRTLRHEAERFAELPRPIRFSLLTPMWKTPPRLLDELILSLRCQSYQHWELLLVDDASPTRDHLAVARAWAARDPRILVSELDVNRGISGARNEAIARATGDFLAILDHDDLLHPQALGVFARHITTDPDVNFLFSNEAKITEDSTVVGHYLTKPPFDLFTLIRTNYVCHFTAVRRDLLLAAARDGQVFRSQYDGCEDHDLFLRIGLTGQVRPAHVPLFLYYWRMISNSTSLVIGSKPEIPRRREQLLDELLPEIYPRARWIYTPDGMPPANTCLSVKLTGLEGEPRRSLLVIVPFKDHVELTIRALEALESQEHDLEVRVVLVDNRSTDPETRPALDAWMAQPRRLRYEVMDHDGAFNFNRMNNLAIARYGNDADLLLFLNNDVELISPDALRTLSTQLLADPGCGFVGLRLMYPNGDVQHGGVAVAPEIFGSGFFTIQHGVDQPEFVWDEKVCLAVTFACAMTRRATFEALGGLDEVLFPNSFGDVDLCLRAVEAGFRNRYFGTVWGYHHESRSRGRIADDVEFANLYERHGGTLARWRLRTLRLEPDHVWRLGGVGSHNASLSALGLGRPLRYVLADRLNSWMKRALGPGHRLLRTAMVRVRTARKAGHGGPRTIRDSVLRPRFRTVVRRPTITP
jgi:GT2 family glycosyltransferase